MRPGRDETSAVNIMRSGINVSRPNVGGGYACATSLTVQIYAEFFNLQNFQLFLDPILNFTRWVHSLNFSVFAVFYRAIDREEKPSDAPSDCFCGLEGIGRRATECRFLKRGKGVCRPTKVTLRNGEALVAKRHCNTRKEGKSCSWHLKDGQENASRVAQLFLQ